MALSSVLLPEALAKGRKPDYVHMQADRHTFLMGPLVFPQQATQHYLLESNPSPVCLSLANTL